jgi:monofunctional biosynthetic peptidoglycan transglycosylase
MASIVPPLAEPPPAPVVEEAEPPPKPKRSLFWRILKWTGLSILGFILFSAFWVILYRFVAPPFTFTQEFDSNGATQEWMPIERIDRNMVRAVIAAEDSKFCTHHGFDTDAIAAAMRSNAAGNRTIRGGSTISQQTAKNAFLWQGGGYFRKGLEAWFTLLMEASWSKRRIMEVYLNIAETGIGTYGVSAAARRYFNHDASRLTPEEAARIAAVLPSPQRRAAVDPAGFTRRYGNTIRVRMAQVARDGLDRCVYE